MAKNWHERIDDARSRGFFAGDDVVAAHQWVDCACGEQDPRIPRFSADEPGGETGAPKDRRLRQLGVRFADHVDNGAEYWNLPRRYITYAKRTLAAIEKRSAEILASLDSGTKEEE